MDVYLYFPGYLKGVFSLGSIRFHNLFRSVFNFIVFLLREEHAHVNNFHAALLQRHSAQVIASNLHGRHVLFGWGSLLRAGLIQA